MAKSGIPAAGTMHDAARVGRNAANNPATTLLVRCGYAAKGVVYLIIGALSAKAALHAGAAATDRNGALRAIYQQPFGKFLLAIVAIGLAGYALWSYVRAVLDPEGKGAGTKGIAARVGYGAIGVSYTALAAAALQLVLGTGNGGKSSDTTTHDWTARLLALPFGPFLVVIAGLAVIGVALFLFYRAYSATFQKRLDLARLGAQGRQGVITLGRCGYAALGVVFSIIGTFLAIAALRHNPHEAKGLGGSLGELTQQPFGHILLAIVAIGLAAYGVYSLAQARYRRIGTA